MQKRMSAPARAVDSRNPERHGAARWGSDLGLWELDCLHDRIVWFGDWCARQGLDPCVGKEHHRRWCRHIHADDLDEVILAFRACRTGQTEGYEAHYRVRALDGQWRWLRERARVVERAADGSALLIAGLCLEEGPPALQVAAREQRRIGRDLHDELGQELTAAVLLLRSLARRLGSGDSRCSEVEQAIAIINDAIDRTRDLARGESPAGAQQGGLPGALRRLATRVRERHGVRVELELQIPEPLALGAEAATHLYRIAQEALTNALRHGRPRCVWLRLLRREGALQLTIEDDGAGFSPAAATAQGLGLEIMRYRARRIGGELRLGASAAGGAAVHCGCPLQPLAPGPGA